MSSHFSLQEITIQNIIEETAEARTFELSISSGDQLHYEAGQFLTLVFPKEIGGEDRRSYSFSSAPLLHEPMAITVKRMANGAYSRKLMQAKVGDQLLTSGASGFFTLPENIHELRQLFFIAAGSGITPVFSLIKTVLRLYPDITVILIYSNRSRKDTIFFDQILSLNSKFKGRFKIDFLFSDDADLLKARLSNSLLLSFVNRYQGFSAHEAYFFLCGPFEYMDMVMITLLTEGIPERHIRKENFNSFIPEVKVRPPDELPHRVFIHTVEQQYALTVQYPDSILTQALKENIPLPYSCRSGQCGSCAAICRKGKVWMAYNEVLTPKELEQGMVLTCMGFPVEGDVTLQI